MEGYRANTESTIAIDLLNLTNFVEEGAIVYDYQLAVHREWRGKYS